ncbi:cuticle protein 7-like isoform X2 [Daktulosphaira vitifoliae]|uniref:cuticle protein 7-like isoform X1 n=1 Tax=Daktulosphaira vitifoliae TaxID=58002 RepID=UPI0021A9CD70|nr:cuticle protein 7-like isoform X1 [Daktulosphaira vitifoliae]XP_050544647.1 cuticle protein 7-like isoform X2 [Daktulosphaira vitifoliae]
MAAKLIVFAACVASALSQYSAPSYHSAPKAYSHEPEYAPSPYSFEYSVHDPHTYDIHSQYEHGDGHGNVKGSYSLVEADGTKRIVDYTADHYGFNAEVKKEGTPSYGSGPAYNKPSYSAPAYSAHSAPAYRPAPYNHY